MFVLGKVWESKTLLGEIYITTSLASQRQSHAKQQNGRLGHVCQLAGYTKEVEEAVSGEYAANTFLTEYDDVQYLTVESSNLPL